MIIVNCSIDFIVTRFLSLLCLLHKSPTIGRLLGLPLIQLILRLLQFLFQLFLFLHHSFPLLFHFTEHFGIFLIKCFHFRLELQTFAGSINIVLVRIFQWFLGSIVLLEYKLKPSVGTNRH